MPLNIVRDDITRMKADAIVNAANAGLRMGGGVCGAIFSAAGEKQLQAACEKLAPIQTGDAVMTRGFKLPAKYIIHAVGPVYRDGRHGEEALLCAAYTNALSLAAARRCKSIAFPLISSGVFGYPKDEALRVATAAMRDFLREHDMDVSLVIYDKESFAVGKELLGAVNSYIDEHYIEEHPDTLRSAMLLKELTVEAAMRPCTDERHGDKKLVFSEADESVTEPAMPAPSIYGTKKMSAAGAKRPALARLETMVGNLDEPFSATLLRLIDAAGAKDSDIYRRANIDRKLFSKIRSNANYAPSKPTVLAFAIALELTLEQTADLLKRAGFALSHSRKFDVIVEFFIASRKYDVFRINEVLFSYDQPLLGG